MQRVDPRQMARWLSRREQHGWNWVELSRRSGHPVWKLRWWQKRLERDPAPETGRRSLVAVEIREPSRRASSITLTTPSGYRLEVASDVDAEQLRRVVEALERRC